MNCNQYLTPEIVSSYIKFNSNDQNWTYTSTGSKELFNIQCEGVAHAWNILEDHSIALLADEVGTGKTYQALGVMLTQLLIKPDSKILIFAPRENVAINWLSEYKHFIKAHYKHNDDILKSSVDDGSIHKICYRGSLHSLVDAINNGLHQIYLSKTTVFSHILQAEESKGPVAIEKVKKVSEGLKIKLNYKFDLLIIDEAHYYRNTSGESQRVNAAKIFFENLSDKVLLVTATPNHSKDTDITNIFSYFSDIKDISEIKEKMIIRRLRRLEQKTKYEYRKEYYTECNFTDRNKKSDIFAAEVFFAKYQKALIHKMLNSKKDKAKNCDTQKGRMFFGYLEACEFMNPQDIDPSDDKYNQEGTDFSKGYDGDIVKKLVEEYNKIFHSIPPHPKYDKVTDQLSADKTEKTVVFVRRIASTNELETRLNKIHSNKYSKELSKVIKGFNRGKYNNILDYFRNREPVNGKGNDKGKGKQTLGANFRQLLISPDSPFFMLFEPPMNKSSSPYIFGSPIYLNGKLKYNETAKVIREQGYNTPDTKAHTYETIWTLYINELEKTKDQNEEIHKIINSLDKEKFEGLSHFFKQGILFASDIIIDLFIIYRSFKNNNHPEYYTFIKKLKKDFNKSRLKAKMDETVLHFDDIWQKSLGISKSDIAEYDFNLFNNSSYALGVTSANNNPNIIKKFNTPFFPNILVSTSVLQEGVNLHMFCNKVLHYGIAWTVGDNEQRNGRVDRVFGKGHKLLINEKKDKSIFIDYPFIKNTVDQIQLCNFIKHKRDSEQELDKLEIIECDKTFGIDSSSRCFKSTSYNINSINNYDPFPYIPKTGENLKLIEIKQNHKNNLLLNSIKSVAPTLSEDLPNISISKHWNKAIKDNTVCLCELKLGENEERKQQVQIKIQYLSTKVGGSVIFLDLISPLAKHHETKSIFDKLDSNPIDYKHFNIVIDNKMKRSSFSYLSCRASLVLKVNECDEILLDKTELCQTVQGLADITDKLEETILKHDFTETEASEKSHVFSNELIIDKTEHIEAEGWEKSKNNDYIYKIIHSVKDITTDQLKEIAKFMLKYPFASWDIQNTELRFYISYLSSNLQKAELDVLEELCKRYEEQLRIEVKNLQDKSNKPKTQQNIN